MLSELILNRGTVGGGVLCWVHAKAVYQRLNIIVLSQKWVVASGGQMLLGVNGQQLLPWGAMRQSVAGKDVNMEAEESTVLGAITKEWLAKTGQTEKT
jgi:hypothetical protein